MKQMIKNHETIESLEDFIYFDKNVNKIKLKKEIVDKNGNDIHSAKFQILGQSTLTYDGSIASLGFSIADYESYDLFFITIMGSLFIFLSSAVILTDSGLKSVGNLIYNDSGNTTIVKVKLSSYGGEGTNVTISSIDNISFSFENAPYGILIGVKF